MYVQIHTVCELTHSVQNYTVVPFAYNMKKIPLTWIFLHSRRDWRDWQIWGMCMCVFVYLYFCIYVFNTWEYQFLISLKNPLFKNMPHVGSFWHFTICFICVFVYFVFVFVFVFVLVITVWQKTSSSLRQYFIWGVWYDPGMI